MKKNVETFLQSSFHIFNFFRNFNQFNFVRKFQSDPCINIEILWVPMQCLLNVNATIVFSYLRLAQYSQQCIHLTEAFQRDLIFSLCNYKLQRYTEKLEQEQSNASSTFSIQFFPLHRGTYSIIKVV